MLEVYGQAEDLASMGIFDKDGFWKIMSII